MAIATWHIGVIPIDIKVKQVYGIIFTNDGYMLLFKDGDGYSLPGGTPELQDCNIEETLRREVIEEVNVIIKTPHIVGYRLIDEENGTELYTQVRMVALISEIKPAQPDPATGRIYDRYLVSPSKAVELLNWQDDGAKQIYSALEVAKKHLEISWLADDTMIVV